MDYDGIIIRGGMWLTVSYDWFGSKDLCKDSSVYIFLTYNIWLFDSQVIFDFT